jgi:hypothetical protein
VILDTNGLSALAYGDVTLEPSCTRLSRDRHFDFVPGLKRIGW